MKQNIIYNRTSTEDQNPENQVKDCKVLVEKLEIKDYEVLEEQKSAFKDYVTREIFDSISRSIRKREVKNLIVWDLDRIYRNRKKLVAFFEMCKVYGCKIYSFRQQFLEDINKAPEPWNEMLFGNMIFIMGWMAEEESSKKSERVRASIRKNKKGKTVSYKGNIWGRKSIQNKVKKEIIKLYEEGKNIRQISKKVHYWDSNNNKKYVSVGFVHKTIQEFIGEKDSKEDVQK